ncbi:MAG: hypothetical protein ABUS79_02100 [Pseudomonadota bacterium]
MRVFNMWVVARPADDLPDQWVAHCLDLDVVTQGTSFEHVIEMVKEASLMVVCDDLAAGKEPTLRRAPDECWAEMRQIVTTGKPVSMDLLSRVPRANFGSVAVQLELSVDLGHAVRGHDHKEPSFNMPLVFERPTPPEIHPC